MKRSLGIILVLGVLVLGGILLAQGLIWSEPVLMCEDTADIFDGFGGYDAKIIGIDSLIVTWKGGRDFGQGVRVRIWGPDGFSPTDELFTDRVDPSVNYSRIVVTDSNEIFIFGKRGGACYWRNWQLDTY